MINHEYYKENKVLQLCNDIYCIGAPDGGAFVVDAVVLGGNYPTVARFNYLDVEYSIADKKEISKMITEMTLKHWEAVGTIFSGFTSGEVQQLYCKDEENVVNLEFPTSMGMYVQTSRGDYLIPSPIWTNNCLAVIREFQIINTKTKREYTNKVAVIHRDKKCLCCGKGVRDGVTLEIDLIIPTKDGGTADIDNMQTLCSECHAGNAEHNFDFLHT